MPTTQQVEEATHTYLLYASKVPALKAQSDELENGIAELTKTKESLEKTIADTQAAMPPLRTELLQLHKDIDDMKMKKADEEKSDRATMDAHHKVIADQTARLDVLANELQKRGFGLDDREKAAAAALQEADSKKRSSAAQEDAVAKKYAELADRESVLVRREKQVEDYNAEVSKKLAKAQSSELSATTAEARARQDRLENEKMTAKAATDLNEAKELYERLSQTKVQINSLLPVLKEFYDYVKTHVKDPDAVNMRFEQLFPLATTAGNQGVL